MALLRCPTCNNRFDVEESPAMPFCSVRCQRIDLGRWLNEEYGLPHESDDESADDSTTGNGD